MLVAAEEGIVELDEPAGPPGSTMRHLLAHASGLPLDGSRPIAKPGTRRIYSNAGIEAAAALVAERAEMPFADYLAAAVLEPLGLEARLDGSPASALAGSLDDLLAFGRELLAPRLLAQETLEEATSVAFPGLSGVLPGYGKQDPNDWGLGFELRDGRRRTGRARETRRGRSATSAAPARSSGWIRTRGSRAPASPTGLRRLVARGLAGARRRGARRVRGYFVKSGRRNSSKVARSQLATVAGVTASTVAVRPTSMRSATSPK